MWFPEPHGWPALLFMSDGGIAVSTSRKQFARLAMLLVRVKVAGHIVF